MLLSHLDATSPTEEAKTSRGGSHPAEAGGPDRHVGPGNRDVEPLPDDLGFRLLAEPHQAFVEAVQAPDVLGMLAGPRQGGVETEIGAVDRLRLLDAALLEQQRAERMARRLHPAPRLVIGQRVVELDRAAQMRERLIEMAFAVLDLAVASSRRRPRGCRGRCC